MTNQHPITPPRELTEQWASEKSYDERDWLYELHIATRAAQWGANQELEACCEWLLGSAPWTVDPDERPGWIDVLRAERRPKPPNLKEQALSLLTRLVVDLDRANMRDQATILEGPIRRALEALDD